MRKVQVFLPLPGMVAAMDAYFDRPNVFYAEGLPTGPELPAAEMPEEELLAFAYDVAVAEVEAANAPGQERLAVDRAYPFFDKLFDEAGVWLGWEFQFEVYSY